MPTWRYIPGAIVARLLRGEPLELVARETNCFWCMVATIMLDKKPVENQVSPGLQPGKSYPNTTELAGYRPGRRNNLQLRTRIFRLLLQEKRLPMHSMPHKGGSPSPEEE